MNWKEDHGGESVPCIYVTGGHPSRIFFSIVISTQGLNIMHWHTNLQWHFKACTMNMHPAPLGKVIQAPGACWEFSCGCQTAAAHQSFQVCLFIYEVAAAADRITTGTMQARERVRICSKFAAWADFVLPWFTAPGLLQDADVCSIAQEPALHSLYNERCDLGEFLKPWFNTI